ncbi:hypothetical protein TRFO_41641 [Tritrichomonas foetus]|uniref:Uncharacterized protein n=1 Tax=Tritrichomonas foetus TaxID=1144522 RepID=A0A1J4L0R0_9EUKA|nr:hypothetical protein TRFO_41641 [Tritrichomonas foetus]|eukprot:OHT16680.1 hypothetical protein TRFO_41641 [Tritrichomonas foetus]
MNHKSDSKNDVTSYRLAFHDASNEIEIKNNDKNLQNGGQDEKDKFFEFAQSTIGIIVLSCSGALIIIVIAVLAIYCRSNGCPSCCRCCSRQNQLATDQYGQVILNNDDDIDYRLDAV